MSVTELDNLVKIGRLKAEPGAQEEFDGLVASGKNRLVDARNKKLAYESRFDLAYNAAHSLSLAALRWHGYRAENRYIVFQALVHTVELDRTTVRILSKCHDTRNLAEYEGYQTIDERLLTDLLDAATQIETKLVNLGRVPST